MPTLSLLFSALPYVAGVEAWKLCLVGFLGSWEFTCASCQQGHLGQTREVGEAEAVTAPLCQPEAQRLQLPAWGGFEGLLDIPVNSLLQCSCAFPETPEIAGFLTISLVALSDPASTRLSKMQAHKSLH